MGINVNCSVNSTLFLNEINILITCSRTMFWIIKNYELIFNVDIYLLWEKILKRLNKEKIIIGGDLDTNITIFDILSRKEIKGINNGFNYKGICVLKIEIYL